VLDGHFELVAGECAPGLDDPGWDRLAAAGKMLGMAVNPSPGARVTLMRPGESGTSGLIFFWLRLLAFPHRAEPVPGVALGA
jgi:hypothetical protein